MARLIRRVTKRVFVILNLVVVAVFLLACLNAFMHPAKWWFIALLGLAFPFLLVSVLLFLLSWIIFRSKWAFLNLLALVLAYTNIRALVGMHLMQDEFVLEKDQSTLRILSWNVTWFDEQTKEVKRAETYRQDMLNFIEQQQADILCFQEYLEPNSPGHYSNVKAITQLGFPHHLIVSDYSRKNGTFQVGVAIFSKHPIEDTLHVRYEGPQNYRAAESLIGIDIIFQDQKLRIFNTHLQSVLFQKKDYRNLEIIRNADDSLMHASRSVVRKLKQAYSFRGDQSDVVRAYLDRSPHPEIVCGDFNDVPNSYTYFTIKGPRKDAFVQTGRGLGRTFYAISPTLRIDYIMANDQFKVLQYKRELLPYSEHYPIIADIQIAKVETE